MENIKAILFDLDETLIIEWKSAEQAFFKTIELAAHKIDKTEFVRVIRAEAKKLWYSLPTIDYCLRVGISSWEALWGDFSGSDPDLKRLSALIDEYRVQSWHRALKTFQISDLALAGRLSDRYRVIRDGMHILFPETIEVLDILHSHYKLGLITNGAPGLQQRKISGGGLAKYFDGIVISGEFGCGKPDVKLFNIAADILKVPPDQILMVGDSLNTDIKGAIASGMKTVWLNRDKRAASEITAGHEITCLSQLTDILNLSA